MFNYGTEFSVLMISPLYCIHSVDLFVEALHSVVRSVRLLGQRLLRPAHLGTSAGEDVLQR